MRRLMALVFSVALLAALSASGQIGYKADADAEQKKTLLLRDFHPQSKIYHLNAEKLFRQFKGTSLISERGGN